METGVLVEPDDVRSGDRAHVIALIQEEVICPVAVIEHHHECTPVTVPLVCADTATPVIEGFVLRLEIVGHCHRSRLELPLGIACLLEVICHCIGVVILADGEVVSELETGCEAVEGHIVSVHGE